MTSLSGPVGVRNGISQEQNAPVDQSKIIRLLWAIEPGNAGMKGVSDAPSPGGFRRCNAQLAGAIAAFQAFLLQRGDLKIADGVVDPGGRTLAKLDALASGAGPAPLPPQPPSDPKLIELNVLRFEQTMPGVSGGFTISAVLPESAMPYLFTPVPKAAALIEGPAGGEIFEFLFRIEKNGVIFWVGACVPVGTNDFTRAYIYFHPDTISSTDDAAYPGFSGRWPTVQRYVPGQGLQLAAVKRMVLLVPFMTAASRSNTSATNLFAERGVETLNDIMAAVQISLGQAVSPASLQQVGVCSFSSGVNHLFRFAERLGGTGIIREQIDFDSAYMINSHKSAPKLAGVVNWMVTQSPPRGSHIGWLQLPPPAWRKVHTMRGDVHSQIGTMMFRTMMTLSVIR